MLPRPRRARWRSAILVLTALVAWYYWRALGPSASIQFDTANIHYPVQKYVAERLTRSLFPFWTPYIDCGYPLAANPQAGVWYPLNWPFLAFGITPRSLEGELALHAWIACVGAYFFIARLARRRAASLAGAMAYGFSGFFASQSGRLDLFQAAAWFPWLLLFYRRALRARGPQDLALGALAGGLMLSTGSLAGAEFAFVGLGLYAGSVAWGRRSQWKRCMLPALAIAAGALPIAAAALVPAWQRGRLAAPTDYSTGTLTTRTLLTLIYPNASGTLTRTDSGRILEHYLYGGILLLPLAALGACKTRHRRAGLMLIVPLGWCMLGPYGGLYFVGRLLGLGRLGPPAAGWFVPALGLALLAAAGADVAARHWGVRQFRKIGRWRVALHRAAPLAIAAFLFADLWTLNMNLNPLAFARQSWNQSFGLREVVAARQLAGPALPFTRFDAPGNLLGAGPAMHPLDLKLEATYGYVAWELRAYREYRGAMQRNLKLRDALNVSRYLSPATQQIEYNPGVLPRAWFPLTTMDVADEARSRQLLETLDPRGLGLLRAPHPAVQQDPRAEANILRADEQSCLIHYVCRTPSLLALSMAWYPGWRATVQNRELPVLRVDHALLGVVAPEGDNLLRLEFEPERLGLGLWTSAGFTVLAGVLAVAGVAHAEAQSSRRRRRRRPLAGFSA